MTDNASSRGLALLALILLVPAASIGTTFGMTLEASEGLTGQLVYGAAKVWLLIFPVFWLLAVDRGRLSWSPPRRGGFGTGIALGLIITVVVVAAYLLVGRNLIDPAVIRDEAVESGFAVPWRYIAFAVYLCTINAALEEYVWRWFVFRKCEVLVPAAGGWIAVVLSAIFFTIHHVIALFALFGGSAALLASIGVFIGGAVWSWCYLRFRSIWPGYVSHVIVDITVFVIGWQLIFG